VAPASAAFISSEGHQVIQGGEATGRDHPIFCSDAASLRNHLRAGGIAQCAGGQGDDGKGGFDDVFMMTLLMFCCVFLFVCRVVKIKSTNQ
jgi:hypothetical protein